MDQKGLISLLRESAIGHYKRTPFCPDDHEIAGFVDGTLNDSVREHVERHLPDCQACVNRVGLLTRLLREHASAGQPEAPKHPGTDWKRIAPQWAIAASILLAATFIARMPAPESVPVIDIASDYQTTRNIGSRTGAPEILAPSSGVISSRDGFVIRWTEVPGSLYYEVRIVTDAGDLVREQRVEGTEWTIGHDLNLKAGREYYLRVDAYLSDAKSISSQHIPFKVQD